MKRVSSGRRKGWRYNHQVPTREWLHLSYKAFMVWCYEASGFDDSEGIQFREFHYEPSIKLTNKVRARKFSPTNYAWNTNVRTHSCIAWLPWFLTHAIRASRIYRGSCGALAMAWWRLCRWVRKKVKSPSRAPWLVRLARNWNLRRLVGAALETPITTGSRRLKG
jgi:hypothetical protein